MLVPFPKPQARTVENKVVSKFLYDHTGIKVTRLR